MNKVKQIKIALLALVAALVLAMPATAFAGTLTINDTSDMDHTYTATQVFKGTIDDQGKLTNIDWAEGFNSAGLIAAMNADTRFAIPEGANATAANAAAKIGTLSSNLYDPSQPSARTAIDDLAELIKANLGTAPATEITKANGVYTATLSDGWYFVEDTTTFDDDNPMPENFVRSRYILDLSTNPAINAKADYPTVDKKVKEDDGTEAADWREVADYEIGQTIPYMLKGTLPNNYADYKFYYYKFTDEMCAGLTYNGDAKVYVVTDGVKTEVTSSFTILPAAAAAGATLTVECADLKVIPGVTIKSTSEIIVEYTCVLNDSAAVGLAGNPNDVYLTYSNNPNQEKGGEPETGDTPKEYCIVFTFQMDNFKKDAATGELLPGAGFKLYKMDGQTKVYYTGTKDTDGKMIWGTEAQAKEFMLSENASSFNITGLDSRDTYFLTESTVPSGYVQMADFQFVIGTDTAYATEDYNPETVVLTKIYLNDESKPGTVADGKVAADHLNNSGSTLPSTGGIGTTIFTVVGIGLIVAAVASVVVRRRRSTTA